MSSIGPAFNMGSFCVEILNPLVVNVRGGRAELANDVVGDEEEEEEDNDDEHWLVLVSVLLGGVG